MGWSYGAVVGAHWAHRNPQRTAGAVLVDGAFLKKDFPAIAEAVRQVALSDRPRSSSDGV